MDFIYIILIIALIGFLIYTNLKKNKTKTPDIEEPEQNNENSKTYDTEYIKSAYQHKWMFTLNEKDNFYALEKIVKEENLRLFAKVRLFDLVTPIRNHPKYKTNLYKIQAKHLDFVITTNNLVAKYVIELDDNSHNRDDRKKRDSFVDTVLQACGYKVLHVRAIQEDVIRSFLKDNTQLAGKNTGE